MSKKYQDFIYAALWGVIATMFFFIALSIPASFPYIVDFLVSIFPYIFVWFIASLLILITFFRS